MLLDLMAFILMNELDISSNFKLNGGGSMMLEFKKREVCT